MKRENIVSEKNRQQNFKKIRWKELGKCLLVMCMTAVMLGNPADFSVLTVSAQTEDIAFHSDTVTEEGAVEVTTADGATYYETFEAALMDAAAATGEVTLKLLQDIDGENIGLGRTVNTNEAGSLTIDLNGCQLGYKVDEAWQEYGIIFSSAGAVSFTDSSEARTGYLHGMLKQDGTAPFTIKGGTYETVEAGSGAALRVTGSAEIKTLKVQHEIETRAEVELSGGHYGAIEVTISDAQSEEATNTALSDETVKLAIEDMLAEGFAFYNSEGEEQEIARTTTTAADLTVGSMTVDETNAAVRIEAVKSDGTGVETTYYRTWKAAAEYLGGEDYVDTDKTALYETWESVRVVLLKDVKMSGDVELWGSIKLPDITVCSETGSKYTLTGTGSNSVLDCGGMNVTLENIKIADGCISMRGTGWQKLTLESGVEVSGAPPEGYTSAVIEVSSCDLVLNDAKVICTTDGMYAVDLYDAVLYMSGDKTALASAYIDGNSRLPVIAVIDANAANTGDKVPVFTAAGADADLTIYYTGIHAQFDAALANYDGNVKEWYQIELHDGVVLAEGKNVDTVTTFEGNTYGLFRKNKTERFNIYFGDDACYYTTHQLNGSAEPGGSWAFNSSTPCFLMPQSKANVYRHNWEKDGSCSKFSSCQRINLPIAYENDCLEIEGLEGRTYDSYPQILSKITWKSKSGGEVLTAPTYQSSVWPKSKWKPLGVGGEEPLNSNAEYTVVYKNNTNSYPYAPGEEGFDPDKAPQVKISGYGSYYCGSFTVYFTIGEGEMHLGNFQLLGAASDIIYDGNSHKAWNKNAVEYKLDDADRGQFTQLDEEDMYVPACDRTYSYSWFGEGENDWENPTQVEYSTDGGQTWNVEMAFGREGDTEHAYMITDAGKYPFYIRVTNKNCGVLVSEELTAKITPRNLNSNGITLDTSEAVTAYFTGRPIIPTDWDSRIVDTGLSSGDSYVLAKGTDFTVSAENNTDVTDSATVRFTGTGNYTGELTADFAIKNAFTLAQTAVSRDKWYKEDYYWQDGVPVLFFPDGYNPTYPIYAKFIVYRDSKTADVTFGDTVELYVSLEDAVAGTNPGYTFREEGMHTVRLWGKDSDTGYISAPVDVTLNIDVTAPTWADKDGNEAGYGIQVKENWWRKLLNTVSFGLFYNDNTLEINITANDEKNGVNKVSGYITYYCYIQKVSDEEAEGGSLPVKTVEDLDALWKQHNINVDYFSGFARVGFVGSLKDKLSADGNYIIYARAVDKSENESDYICSQGVVIDTAVPDIDLTMPSKTDGTLKDTEATIRLTTNENATLMYFYVHEDEFDSKDEYNTFVSGVSDYLTKMLNQNDAASGGNQFAVKQDGQWTPNAESGDQVSVTDTDTRTVYRMPIIKAGENLITITEGLQPSMACTVWMAAIDRAGNMTTQTESFTTTKAMPKVETLPEVSGVYGDTAADLTVIRDGVAKYGDAELIGGWKVTDTGDTLLQIGTDVQCQVTFTPDASYNDTYESMVLYVTPTIAKRPITVWVEDLHKNYGEPMPEYSFEIEDAVNALVGSDTTETIYSALESVISDKATRTDADAGVWYFQIESLSENYDVTVKYCESLSAKEEKSSGALYIAQAAGEIIKTAEFNGVQDVQYKYDGDFATFNLGVQANNSFSELQFRVTDAKNANGDTIADTDIADKLLSVSADGTVTLKGAGSATITVSLPENNNYKQAAPVTVTVNIAKADVTIPEFVRSVIYLRENSVSYDMVSANRLNPERLGAVSYGDGSGNNADAIGGMTIKINDVTADYDGAKQEFFVLLPYIPDGTAEINCTIKSLADYTHKTAVVTIPAESENCVFNGGNGLTFRLEIVDKKTVEPQTEVEVTGTLTYGEPLSKLTLNKTTFIDSDSQTVDGTLTWKNPEDKPSAVTTSASWIFTPFNEEYAPFEDTAAITVLKATPTLVTVPTVAERSYSPRTALADSDITGGNVTGVDGNALAGTWSWQSAGVIPEVGNTEFVAVFTPDDSTNYDTITEKIAVRVTKAAPIIAAKPTAAAITYGSTLEASVLNGGKAQLSEADDTAAEGSFTWKDNSIKPTVADSGRTEYTVVFTPTDSANYDKAETTVTVTVNKAPTAPDMPDNTMNVQYRVKKVSAVTLPKGWIWQDSDKDSQLSVGVTVNATALYNGADKDNYEIESVVVAITRLACDHKSREVRNEEDATCEYTGYTGDIYCRDCGKLMESGTEIPLSEHTGGTATCVNKAICEKCGKAYGTVDSSKHGDTELRGYAAQTCTAGGYTGDTYCKDCGVMLAGGTATAALGHDYTDRVTKEPTVADAGIRTYTCNRCNDTYEEVIPKLPETVHQHSYTAAITRQADCTDAGIITYTCSCGDSYTETIAALGHSYTSKVTKEATAAEEGVITYTCSNCGHSYTEPIDKLHDGGQDNDTGKPYIKDDSGKSGWQNITGQIEEAQAGDTVMIDMNGTTAVPSNLFEQVRGKDVKVVFDMGNGIVWTVNGKDVTDIKEDINLEVTCGSDAGKSIPADVINNITGEHYSMKLTLAYSGEFGFAATLTTNMEEKNAGYYANLFYYNQNSNRLEFICAERIDETGNVDLTFTHASDYIIVISDAIMNTTDTINPVSDDDGNEGILSGWWFVLGGLIIVVIGLVVFFAKKRKKSE